LDSKLQVVAVETACTIETACSGRGTPCPLQKKKDGKQKMAVVHHAHCAQKHGNGESHPLRTEKWLWYITPFAKRRMSKSKMAVEHHADSRPLQREKRPCNIAVFLISCFDI